jgi:hypothetical protein
LNPVIILSISFRKMLRTEPIASGSDGVSTLRSTIAPRGDFFLSVRTHFGLAQYIRNHWLHGKA